MHTSDTNGRHTSDSSTITLYTLVILTHGHTSNTNTIYTSDTNTLYTSDNNTVYTSDTNTIYTSDTNARHDGDANTDHTNTRHACILGTLVILTLCILVTLAVDIPVIPAL